MILYELRLFNENGATKKKHFLKWPFSKHYETIWRQSRKQ